MKRSYLFSSIAAAFFVGLLATSGCKAPTVAYQVRKFATLRVMNFAPSGQNCTPTAPIDVYWDVASTPVDQIEAEGAKVHNLKFGESSVYTNSIAAAPGGTAYQVVVTPTTLKSTELTPLVTLMPGMTYTLLVTLDPNNPTVFKDTLIQDQTPPASNPFGTNATFVRFLNMRSGVGPLTAHVNDPVTGDLVTPTSGENFFQITPYVAINTATDTSYAFLVSNSANQVLARLSYQTFSAGSYYTLVYGGDPCSTVATNPADSSISALDTFRLHAFDDNSNGNDQTNPILPSFRYNIVNDIVPVSYPYNANHPTDSMVGFIENGVTYSEFGGFSIPPVHVYQGGGEYVSPVPVNGAYDVNYQSAIIPSPLVVKGFATDHSGSYQSQLFNAGVINPLGETALLLDSNNNKTWTMIFMDTVPSPEHPTVLDTSLSRPGNFQILPVPDESSDSTITLVFIAGIVDHPPNTLSKNYTSFWLNIAGVNTISPGNAGGGMGTSKNPKVLLWRVLPGASPNITVTDSIGEGTRFSPRVFGNTATFTADAGGIYEIVSTGIKTDPHLLIMHVNAKNP